MMTDRSYAMRDMLLERVYEEMGKDENIFFICADFGSPVLDKIRADHKKRFLNVGIAEQNLINISTGLALEGFTVFAYAIAPFITMRCYEQTRVSLAILSNVRKMNVNLVGVGAGFSYSMSGPTHQCFEDISIMRTLPNLRVLSVADGVVASEIAQFCLQADGPKYIRLDAQPLKSVHSIEKINLTDGYTKMIDGKGICIVSTGFMTHTCLDVVGELKSLGLNPALIDMHELNLFNKEKLLNDLQNFTRIVSVEEGFKGKGGMDSMLFELLSSAGMAARLESYGIPGEYVFTLNNRIETHEQLGIGPKSLVKKITEAAKV